MSLFYPQVTHTLGGNTAGTMAQISSGTYQLAGGNNITLSQNANTVTISQQPPVISFWQNMEGGNSNTINFNTNTLYLVPLDIGENVFVGNMSVETVLFNMSGFTSQTNSSAFVGSFSVGLYTFYSSTRISLINSGSTSWSMSANANNSNSWYGPRWMSLVSSQWSAQISLTQTNYVMGFFLNMTTNSGTQNKTPKLQLIGQSYFGTQNRSGTLNQNSSTGTSLGWGLPFLGVYSVSTNRLPNTIAYNQVSKAGAGTDDNFAPHIVFNNLTSII